VARPRGIPTLVDGAQSLGAIPVDVKALGCDFYTTNGHKYCMGPTGTGALYVARERLEWLQPSFVGSHSQASLGMAGELELLPSARRFEYGTRNVADHAGWAAALELWAEVGWPRVFVALAAYTDYVKAQLLTVPGLVLRTALPYLESSGIVVFHIPGHSGAVLCDGLAAVEELLVSLAMDRRVIQTQLSILCNIMDNY
jgi:L-cysteine/cystine lyase